MVKIDTMRESRIRFGIDTIKRVFRWMVVVDSAVEAINSTRGDVKVGLYCVEPTGRRIEVVVPLTAVPVLPQQGEITPKSVQQDRRAGEA